MAFPPQEAGPLLLYPRHYRQWCSGYHRGPVFRRDHCCTVATILELGKDAVTPIGRIGGIDGLPFDGLEVRKLTKGTNWQCIAHRPYLTACGNHYDAADVLAVYAFTEGSFQDQTVNFGDYLQDVLRQDLAKWRQEKNRSMDLLQTMAVDFAVVGQKDAGKRFFALNLSQLMPSLQSHNVDPNACLDALESLVDRVPVAGPVRHVRSDRSEGREVIGEQKADLQSLFVHRDHPIIRSPD